VWREADDGRNVVFDVLFPRGVKLPFRYLECAQLSANNQPQGEIDNWDEIRVAFDPNLRNSSDLADQPIQRCAPAQKRWIQEEYTCDASGDVKVKMRDTFTDRANEYRLGRWSKHRKRIKRG
jgi:hypothetical protein